LFANLLSDQDRLRLVVLNSCEGARTTLTDPYAGVATTLIQLGVPAVVAMQFEISDDAAVLFAEELYTNLVGRQDPIDAAVAEARKAVYTEIDAIEWATPVLFVRDPDVELFRFEMPAAPLPPPPPPGDPEVDTARKARPITRFAGWADARPRPMRWALGALAVLAVIAAALGVFGLVRGDDDDAVVFPTVDPGSVGAEVTAAQYLFNEQGIEVEVTGLFDDATTQATRQFEQQVGIIADAVLGPLTWSELVITLQPDREGQAVRAVQTLLNDNGAALPVDGRFDSRTRDAVIAFERANELHVDGIVDVDVWKHLLAQSAE
jgi:peptidoglycan hydrolase-like protein with peptidoglycan-binding domain